MLGPETILDDQNDSTRGLPYQDTVHQANKQMFAILELLSQLIDHYF